VPQQDTGRSVIRTARNGAGGGGVGLWSALPHWAPSLAQLTAQTETVGRVNTLEKWSPAEILRARWTA